MSYDPQYPMLAKVEQNLDRGPKVEMRTLTEVLEEKGLENLNVLKCDAESCDVEIMNSAREIFEARQVKLLFFEAEALKDRWNEALIGFDKFLLARGYKAAPNNCDMCYYLPLIKPS
jgi:Methyltransferase FkbM domain